MRVTSMLRWCVLCVIGVGCSSEMDRSGESAALGKLSQQLTDAQARVLGFELPTSDWSSPQAILAATATTSEGTQALAVTPQGWTEINSVPLASLGEVADVLSVDIRLPEVVTWGEARVVLQAPSLGLWGQELGSVSLVGLAAGSFNTLQFALTDALQEKLAGTYSDLTIRVILNMPAFGSPSIVDRLSIAESEPSTPTGPAGTSQYGSLVQSLPDWALPRTNAATALHELRVNDYVVVQSTALEPADVASLGVLGTNLGVEAELGDVTSIPTVVLRDRAQVFGNVTTAGAISYFPGATIHGTSTIAAALESGSIDFQLDLGPRGPDFEAPSTSLLGPGRYGRVAVQGGTTTMTFSSGVYALNDLYVAYPSELLIDSSNGPVVVLVSDSVTIHGRVRDVDGGFPEWILAYSGTQEVPVNFRLDGAYFAPNAKVNVATTPFRHEGVVLANDVELHQRSLFIHNYYAPVAHGRACSLVTRRTTTGCSTTRLITSLGNPGSPSSLRTSSTSELPIT